MTQEADSSIAIITEPISIQRLTEMAAERFGDMVKAVVDTNLRRIALGGQLHSDEEAALLALGSRQRDLWGINIYPEKPRSEWIEFDSMIKISDPVIARAAWKMPARRKRSARSSIPLFDE